MLDSIFTGMTGLLGFSKGLKTISNNTANMNTPGYKESSLQFSDLFYPDGNLHGGKGGARTGFGLDTGNTSLNFRQGEFRGTGNDLDLAIDGLGMFTLRGKDGKIHYTRAGQFRFDAGGDLVDRQGGDKVLGLDSNGNLANISIAGRLTSPPQATATVSFKGNLSSTSTTQNVSATVIDAKGAARTLTLQFTNLTATGSANTTWSVSVLDGATPVGSGVLNFTGGNIAAASSGITLRYTPAGAPAQIITLDFGADVTSLAAGTVSSLSMSSQDGRTAGAMTKSTFDAAGVLTLTYSNGQTVAAMPLAISKFDTPDAVVAVGGNRFDAAHPRAWHAGKAGTDAFGAVRAGGIEASNVDLSQEFSDLVIMQRGYQSSSQVISTANEMLQELFTMKGK